MYFNKFQQGDSVQYCGRKQSLQSLLSGKEGLVVARVQCDDHEVVVTFGNDAYVLDERVSLESFVKRSRPKPMESKGPDVQKRRGVSEPKSKGGKRRASQEET